MKVFILDDQLHDDRQMVMNHLEGHDVTGATSLHQAKSQYRKHEPFDLLLLDHDLGWSDEDGEDNTGYEFVKWLVGLATLEKDRPVIVVHSWSSGGGRRMMNYIHDYTDLTRVTRLLFGKELFSFLDTLKAEQAA